MFGITINKEVTLMTINVFFNIIHPFRVIRHLQQNHIPHVLFTFQCYRRFSFRAVLNILSSWPTTKSYSKTATEIPETLWNFSMKYQKTNYQYIQFLFKVIEFINTC